MAPQSRVVVAQPAVDVWDYENHWQKNFTDCCEDCGTCCCACFCYFCFVSVFFYMTPKPLWDIPDNLV